MYLKRDVYESLMKPPCYLHVNPGPILKNQMDYRMINQGFRNSVKSLKTYPGADIHSYHLLFLGKIKLRIKKIQKHKHKKDQSYRRTLRQRQLGNLYITKN